MPHQSDPAAHRPRSDLTVPLAAMLSGHDIEHAEELLVVHVPRLITRTYCVHCQTAWPCPDVRLARILTAGQAIWSGPGV